MTREKKNSVEYLWKIYSYLRGIRKFTRLLPLLIQFSDVSQFVNKSPAPNFR